MNAPRPLVAAINVVLLGISLDALAAVDTTGFVYTPITPCRIIDTRVTATPFAAKETRTFSTNGATTQGGGACMVYPGAIPSALSLNVTVDATGLGSPAQVGFLSVLPVAGAGSSWMNFVGGETIANAGVAAISPADGTFSVKSQNPANVIIDVYGYWVPSPVQRSAGASSTAMGDSTVASNYGSTAMGLNTTASGIGSTAMNEFTVASGGSSTAMGLQSVASGGVATAMGSNTKADGHASVAMGSDASSNGHDFTFVFGDGSLSGGASTVNTTDYQFMVRASGGFVFYSSSNPAGTAESTGVYLSPGNGSWSTLSDRNAKDSVRPIDSRDVLERVVAMPLNTWRYKAQDPKYRHMGPMAQDFYAAFQLGESDTGIDTIDADGVALAAIQGLNAKLVDKDKEIEALKLRVASLESMAGDIAEMKHELAALRQARIPNDTVVAMTSEPSH